MDAFPKTALVTGAGARVGRRVALELAQSGCDVAVHHLASATGAAELVAEIQAGGGSARTYRADLSDPAAVDLLAAQVLADFGHLDLLVNCAAIWPRTPLRTLDAAAFDQVIAVNLRAPFLLSVAIGLAMKKRGKGLIINLLDWSLDRPYPDFLPYGIAKSGLAAATRGLARALAPEVRVNGIAPGTVLLPDWISAEETEAIVRAIPLGRVGEPGDIAGAVLFLCRADYATGSILTIDGGRSLR